MKISKAKDPLDRVHDSSTDEDHYIYIYDEDMQLTISTNIDMNFKKVKLERMTKPTTAYSKPFSCLIATLKMLQHLSAHVSPYLYIITRQG
jgi:hypothetical protein